VASKPEHAYTWAVGGEVVGGQVSSKFEGLDRVSTSAIGLRGIFDYYVLPKAKIGVQGSLTFASVGEGENANSFLDLGAAGYRLFCFGRVCATPQLGLSIGVLGVNGDEEAQQTTIGLRLGGSVGYAMGKRLEHVVSASLGANLYAIGETSTDAMDGGTSRWINFGVGYTYRFNTPLGSSPFVTLE
jgi:hypothetical protein